MPGGIGPLELVIVLLIVLVIFGPKRLPGLGRSLGSGMREFKDSLTGKTRADEEDEDDKPDAQALAEAPEAKAPDAAAPAPEQTVEGEVVADRRS